jgi:hypothetical protein
VIDFVVSDMTHLRYFAPFTSSLSRLGFRTRWLLEIESAKYNAINASKERVNFVCRLAETLGVSSVEKFNRTERGRCAITVETGTPNDKIIERYDNVVSMQHGFDYTVADRVQSSKIQYVMWDQLYVDHHRSSKLAGSYSVPDVPVTFWMPSDHCRLLAGDGNIATIFYPEYGMQDLVDRACRYLTERSIRIVLKQRRKNQLIAAHHNAESVYDDIWQPSESIFYPSVSSVCLGFGTSAYTDAVPAGLTFIDCAMPSYSQTYPKPDDERFFSCTSETLEQTIEAALKNTSIKKEMSECDQDKFTLRVMEKSHVSRS